MIAFIVVVIVISAGVFGWMFVNQKKVPATSQPIQKTCTEEARICLDGSYIGRTGPNCEFAPCPGGGYGDGGFGSPRMCTMEAKLCPDGSYVGRTGPNCEFSPCQNSEKGAMSMYRNERLGFEMKIPQEIDGIKFKTVESGNVILFGLDGTPAYKEAIGRINGVENDFEKVKGVSWAMLIKKVSNDSELDVFIKNRYGNGCELGGKELDPVSGLFDIRIKPIDPGAEPGEFGSCFLNWALFLKYSPEKNSVASVDLGQAVSFSSAKDSTVDYDSEMVKSFRFIK